MFFRRSLPDVIAVVAVLSAIALLLYRETALFSTVDRDGRVLVDLDQLNIEDQIAVHRSLPRVGERFGNPEAALFAFDHQLQPFRPTRDDSIQSKGRGLVPLIRAVE